MFLGEATKHVAPAELRTSRWVGCVLQICRSYGAHEAMLLQSFASGGFPETEEARL